MNKQRISICATEDEPSAREKRMWMIAFGVGFAVSLFINLGSVQAPLTQQPANKVNESWLATLPATTTAATAAVDTIAVAERNRFN